MNPNPRQNDYPTEKSRLSFYPGTCHTPIGGELWHRHIETLRTLEHQTRQLGMFEISYEFSLEIARHIAAQLKDEIKAIDQTYSKMKEEKMTDIKIEIKPNNCYFKMGCGICGQTFDLDAATAELIIDGKRAGDYDVCPDCLAAGPTGAAKRAKEHADHLRKWADYKDELAVELAITPTTNWKTDHELYAKARQHDEEIQQEQEKYNEEIGKMVDDASKIADIDIPF